MRGEQALGTAREKQTEAEAVFVSGNRDMFGVGSQARPASPFYRVTPRTKSAAPSFPTLLMSNGFDRNAAKADAILTLRMTANQSAKALPASKEAFLKALGREVALKRGDFEADMMMRDALMEKFLQAKS